MTFSHFFICCLIDKTTCTVRVEIICQWYWCPQFVTQCQVHSGNSINEQMHEEDTPAFSSAFPTLPEISTTSSYFYFPFPTLLIESMSILAPIYFVSEKVNLPTIHNIQYTNTSGFLHGLFKKGRPSHKPFLAQVDQLVSNVCSKISAKQVVTCF
jgi:hypothetical protein